MAEKYPEKERKENFWTHLALTLGLVALVAVGIDSFES